ncbi:acyl-CoA thioesterase [Natranaerobius thermophilus]|uniref:Thioesterase superfamily protein n=1 Tax=Natranaerobius thermophilus (strain ATCC BAA-1301 / DSM 18059 / JW/NM-WN-LF) TaxID=457570 RepID=B2A6D6_NATTJ|nr:thioesterase family protein [Natranaerobius thermophilus]ACB84147.1 thioesterase superfamily protein [Natranaerobius thermophilus JW/NM-WN-LF]
MISKTNIRVRYQETDQMGVVYYANYLVWFEVGRNHYFRELDFPYRDMEKAGIYIPVISANCNYQKPARYDDLIEIQTKITKMTSAKIWFNYEIIRGTQDTTTSGKGDRFLAKGETSHAFVNETGKPVAFKKYFPDLYNDLKNYIIT